MKNPVRLPMLIKKLSLGLVILTLPHIVHAEEVPATVDKIQGDVVVTDPSGTTVQVSPGSKIPTGDTIKTGADGTVGLILTPGSGTVVMPNSEVKISSLNFTKEPDGSNNRKVRLNLKNGNLISTLFKKDGHSDFQVATPYGVAAAKGTSWGVNVDGTTLTISVADGIVTVTNAAGQVVATVTEGKGYDNHTNALSSLSGRAITHIYNILKAFLPDMGKKQLIKALENASLNPATANSKQEINSPNGDTNSK